MATRSIVARVVTFFSADPDADALKFSRLSRLGVGWALVRPSGLVAGRQVVAVKVRVGSIAERYALRYEARGRGLAG